MSGKSRKGKQLAEGDTFSVHRGVPPAARALASILHSLARVPSKKAARAVGQGLVRVNGLVIRDARYRVATGDRIQVAPGVIWHPRGPAPAGAEKPVPKAPTPAKKMPRPALLYRDADIAVVFKPAGLLTVPSPKGEKKTLLHWLGTELRETHPRKALRAVQRLDREVSGILVFALSEAAFDGLRRQFEQHLPERRYLALVAGEVSPPQGTFSSRIATGRSLRRYSVESGGGGERAITHYRVVQQSPDAALVEVWLETGRRHQIRVHFAEAGNPVLGDSRYRRIQAAHRSWPPERLALHAALLAFEHPVSGQPMKFHSELPWEFTRFPGIVPVAVGDGEKIRGNPARKPRKKTAGKTGPDGNRNSAKTPRTRPGRVRKGPRAPPPPRIRSPVTTASACTSPA